MNHTAIDEREAATFAAARRRLRWMRWLWLLIGLVVYAGWDAVDQLLLTRIDPLLGGFGIDWGMIFVLGCALMFLLSRWEDQQLARLEQLAAQTVAVERYLAQLAAAQATARGVAHHLNQPLAAIRGYAELLREQPPAERSDADLSHIVAMTDRAAAIVRQLVQITQYETVPYAGGAPIVDLSRSSAGGGSI